MLALRAGSTSSARAVSVPTRCSVGSGGSGGGRPAIEAHLHHPGKLVTVAMDQIVFKEPVFVGDLVSLFTQTRRVGTTSITVGVSVWAQRASDRAHHAHVTEAQVTLVAVDEQMRPTPVARP